MSSFHFSHEFAETYSLTFQEFVLRFRIFEACRELQHPNIPVTNVAYSVGFNDPSYFARVFRRFIELSPSEYCAQVSRGEVSQQMNDIVARLNLPEFESTKSERRREDRLDSHQAHRSNSTL
jgi:AraC-like DNA-binding protein